MRNDYGAAAWKKSGPLCVSSRRISRPFHDGKCLADKVLAGAPRGSYHQPLILNHAIGITVDRMISPNPH